MERSFKSIVLWKDVTPVAVSSSTDANPAVVTTGASHGYSSGQRVLIFGHATNISINGTYLVNVLSATTFTLIDERTGTLVAGAGAGAGSGGFTMIAAPVVFMKDFRNAILQIGTKGTATLTVKAAGSLGCPIPPSENAGAFDPAMPIFGGTVDVATNPYTFLQLIDLDTATPTNGSTGVAVAGTDFNKNYEVNTNAISFMEILMTAWTQGSVSAILFLTNNI